MKRKSEKGFTLIELVMVIVILSILAVVAIPQFVNLKGNAETATVDGVIGAVRSGILAQHASLLAQGNDGAAAWPATLDGNAIGACATCFDGVLTEGVNAPLWTKTAANVYLTTEGTARTCTYTNADPSTFVCV